MRLEIVDVFAEAPLQGNQLAVIEGASTLSSEQMLDFAREMNFSETTFVLSRSAERAEVRIFTPNTELPFAGHPTLGTAWVLGRDKPAFTLDLPVGPVSVSFDPPDDNSDASGGICWMSPPEPQFHGSLDTSGCAALLGIDLADLAPQYPPTTVELGPKFGFIGVRDESILANLAIDTNVRAELLEQGVAISSVFVFCEGNDTDYAARMFFEASGLREDPATGSANSAFAIYLRDLCGGGPQQLVVAQGDYMHRPSRIYLDTTQPSYRVGGRVQRVAVGELTNPFA